MYHTWAQIGGENVLPAKKLQDHIGDFFLYRRCGEAVYHRLELPAWTSCPNRPICGQTSSSCRADYRQAHSKLFVTLSFCPSSVCCVMNVVLATKGVMQMVVPTSTSRRLQNNYVRFNVLLRHDAGARSAMDLKLFERVDTAQALPQAPSHGASCSYCFSHACRCPADT